MSADLRDWAVLWNRTFFVPRPYAVRVAKVSDKTVSYSRHDQQGVKRRDKTSIVMLGLTEIEANALAEEIRDSVHLLDIANRKAEIEHGARVSMILEQYRQRLGAQ